MNTIYDQNFYRVAKYVNNIKKQVMIDTTEEFKPYPKNEQYLVSNKGRVYSFKRDAIMNEFFNKDGYPQVNIDRIPIKIHKLVAETFLKKPDNPKYKDINHEDGVKYHNEAENLEYCTKGHNIKQAYNHGLENKQGENNSNTTHTNEEIKKICKYLQDGYSRQDILYMMGYDPKDKHYSRLIYRIYNREIWISISSKYSF